MTDHRSPAVYVTVDSSQGIALVRGRLAEEIVYRLSPNDFSWVPQFSPSTRGWVVPASVASDIAAWGQVNRELVVVHPRKESP